MTHLNVPRALEKALDPREGTASYVSCHLPTLAASMDIVQEIIDGCSALVKSLGTLPSGDMEKVTPLCELLKAMWDDLAEMVVYKEDPGFARWDEMVLALTIHEGALPRSVGTLPRSQMRLLIQNLTSCRDTWTTQEIVVRLQGDPADLPELKELLLGAVVDTLEQAQLDAATKYGWRRGDLTDNTGKGYLVDYQGDVLTVPELVDPLVDPEQAIQVTLRELEAFGRIEVIGRDGGVSGDGDQSNHDSFDFDGAGG